MGIFPFILSGYDIARTDYFQRLKLPVSQLKVRVSYGRLGNQNGAGLYDYLATMSLDALGSNGWLLPTASSASAIKGTIAKTPKMVSPFITWEKVDNANLGLDLMLFDNRLSLEANIYQRMTRDMIGPAEAIPDISGIAKHIESYAITKSTFQLIMPVHRKLPSAVTQCSIIYFRAVFGSYSRY